LPGDLDRHVRLEKFRKFRFSAHVFLPAFCGFAGGNVASLCLAGQITLHVFDGAVARVSDTRVAAGARPSFDRQAAMSRIAITARAVK
jgi:hypothetical protein